MKTNLRNLFEPFFYSILGMIMVSLFAISLIQAIAIQLEGRLSDSFFLYMAAILSFLGAALVYARARRIIKIILDSEYISDLLRK
ncbi:MAG: hypothetical protein ABIH20_01945 [Candidatus Diapherotrites archaeon]